jgi:acyl carrier protein
MDRRAMILEVIERVSGNKLTIAPDASLFESGILDSFALPDVVTALEAAFEVKIPDADLSPRRFDSLIRIESYLESRGK